MPYVAGAMRTGAGYEGTTLLLMNTRSHAGVQTTEISAWFGAMTGASLADGGGGTTTGSVLGGGGGGGAGAGVSVADGRGAGGALGDVTTARMTSPMMTTPTSIPAKTTQRRRSTRAA